MISAHIDDKLKVRTKRKKFVKKIPYSALKHSYSYLIKNKNGAIRSFYY